MEYDGGALPDLGLAADLTWFDRCSLAAPSKGCASLAQDRRLSMQKPARAAAKNKRTFLYAVAFCPCPRGARLTNFSRFPY
jgi:hypothetical protein